MKTLKIFVAGSKELSNERNLFKIIANDVQTEFGTSGRNGVHIEVRTFENFDYFFGKHLKGAQDAYNKYIANEADAVFFVFDDKVGGITREEFDVAYNAFKDNGHPRICVFSKLHSGEPNKDIAALRQMCSAVGQYYTDYTDNTDLRNKIERSIRQLCNAKLSGTLPNPSRRKRKVKKAEVQVGGQTTPPQPPVSPTPKPRRWWLWGIVAALMVALGVGLFGGEDEKSAEKTTKVDVVEDDAQQRRADSLARVVELEKHRSDSLALVAQRLEKEKADRAEQERIAKEKAEQERIAKEKAEKDRLAKEKAEQERIAAEKAEQDRLAIMVAEGKGRDGVYEVGDYYNRNGKEGVVFQVWDGGRHGKIVSLDQKYLQWCTTKQEDIVVGADSDGDGRYNTDKVMSMSDADQYPAFVWCCNKGADWYLPAIDELKLLLLNDSVHDAVNKTIAQKGGTKLYDKGEGQWYWSSTEEDGFCAWSVNMYRGSTDSNRKLNLSYVRAVSAF